MFEEEKYRTFAQRFWAGIIDALLLCPLAFIDALASSVQQPKSILVLLAIVSAFTYPVYSILMHGFFGRTVGKRVMQVIVLDISERRKLSFSQAFLRDIGLVFFSSVQMANLIRNVVVYGIFDDHAHMPA